MTSLVLKRESIDKYGQGVLEVDLSKQYERSTSTIRTLLKQTETVKGITPARVVTIISKLRSSLHEKIEKLLLVLVTEKPLKGDTSIAVCKLHISDQNINKYVSRIQFLS